MTRKLILKFLLYLYSITTDPLKMTRHRGRAEVSACLLLFILVLDLHRYGAWYSGNRCFLRPYAVPVLIIIAMPFIIYAMAVMIRWFIKTERFNLLVFIISTLGLYVLFSPFIDGLADQRDHAGRVAPGRVLHLLEAGCVDVQGLDVDHDLVVPGGLERIVDPSGGLREDAAGLEDTVGAEAGAGLLDGRGGHGAA